MARVYETSLVNVRSGGTSAAATTEDILELEQEMRLEQQEQRWHVQCDAQGTLRGGEGWGVRPAGAPLLLLVELRLSWSR